MAKIKSEPKTQIERIREVSPRYADLLVKNSELYAQREVAFKELRPLAEADRATRPDEMFPQRKAPPKPIKRHSGAVSLVGHLLTPQPEQEVNPPPLYVSPTENRRRELSEQIESLTEAILLLAPELRRAKRDYSAKVAGQLRSEYVAHVEAVVDTAKGLGDAIFAHHEFINARRLDGVAYQEFRPIRLDSFGNLDDPYAPLMRVILEAVERGHVGAGKIPTWKMSAGIWSLQGGEV